MSNHQVEIALTSAKARIKDDQPDAIRNKGLMRNAYMRADISVQPDLDDTIVTPDGVVWNICDIKTPAPDGVTPIYHKLELES